MTAFEQAWDVVKIDFDFIEGVPWEKRVDYIARKLANHYSPGEDNEDEYKRQTKLLEQEIESRKDSRYRDGRAMFPTDESQHDQIGPSFYGQYIAPDTDIDDNELHDERIIFNLPGIYDSVKSKVRRDARRNARKYRLLSAVEDAALATRGPGTDRFERDLIDRIIQNMNHEFGHAITRDEIERFSDEMIDWDTYDWRAERTKDDAISRHKHAQEALAHIMEAPHNPNWRGRFERHDDIYRWLRKD